MEGFKLLPAPPGTCQECAVDHKPDETHDKRSLFYQMQYRAKWGRWPTWTDAMAHLTPEMKEVWKETLKDLKLWSEEEETKSRVPDVCPTDDQTLGTVTTYTIKHPRKRKKKS